VTWASTAQGGQNPILPRVEELRFSVKASLVAQDLVAAIDIQEATLMDMRIQGKETDQNERDTPEKI
jgi:hypothetical protein